MSKVIKEIIIMLLICLVTMLVLAILLYRYIPNRKVVPEVTTYVATEDVQTLLEDDVDSDEGKDDILLTYEVTSSDLKNYQATEDYVPGKANPFGPYNAEEAKPDGNSSSTDSTNTLESGTVPSVYSDKSGTK